MSDLIELYQKRCSYKIVDVVQSLDFEFDPEQLRREIFKFIVDNNFGFSAVSLRLPENENNFASDKEILEATGIDIYDLTTLPYPDNIKADSEYTKWHPDLINSYVASLVPGLEEYCGFKIGRIRLGWLQPDSGYPIHVDLEPLRLHIPLFTNDLAYFIHDRKIYNMKYGKLWHLITTKIHTAYNFGKLPRLHLIFSTYTDVELESEIKKIATHTQVKQNFVDQISEQGIDKYSLLQMFNITNLNNKNKAESLRELKRIFDLLS
jgi:hypothetical protein